MREPDGSVDLAEESSVPARTAPLTGRRFQFFVLTIAAMAVAVARFAIMPLQETIRGVLSLTDHQIALMLGPAAALPVMLGAIPLGLAIDRCSRVRLLLIFTTIDLAAALLAAIAHDFGTLFLSRCLLGLMGAAIGTTELSLVADIYPSSQRGRARAILNVGQYVGASIAFALGGALLAAFDLDDGWRWTLFWLTAPLMPVLLLILLLQEPTRAEVMVRGPSMREGFAELWRHRPVVLPLLVGLALIEIALNAALIWAAPALSRGFALTPAAVGGIMATTMMASGLFGPIVAGIVTDFCHRTGGPRRTIAVLSAVALLAAPAGLFAVMPNVASGSVLLIAFITIVAAAVLMGTTQFAVIIPNELRGLCFGIFVTVASVSSFAPVVVSVLSEMLGGPAMLGRSLSIVCLTSAVLCAATFAATSRHFPSSTANKNEENRGNVD
jgi:predicted MFS family arabinose efflux permease